MVRIRRSHHRGRGSIPRLGTTTQAKVDRLSTTGEHEHHAVRKTEWHNSRTCYSYGDSGHWQHSLKCLNSKRVIVRRPEKGFFSG